jgi:toxin-antitoxin system PIN domain toxin
MKYLLDVNVLVAACHTGHSSHERVRRWFSGLKDAEFLTSPITELGFVRVSVHGSLQPSVAVAVAAFDRWKKATKARFVMDDVGTAQLPAWADSAAKTTDGHLMALAQAHGAKLATLDTRIPDAVLLP